MFTIISCFCVLNENILARFSHFMPLFSYPFLSISSETSENQRSPNTLRKCRKRPVALHGLKLVWISIFNSVISTLLLSQVYLRPCQIFTMKHSAKIFNCYKLFLQKSSNIDDTVLNMPLTLMLGFSLQKLFYIVVQRCLCLHRFLPLDLSINRFSCHEAQINFLNHGLSRIYALCSRLISSILNAFLVLLS